MRPATLEAYGRDLRDLYAFLLTQKVAAPAEIASAHLAEHLASLRRDRNMQPSSVARHLATIKVFCRWLHANNAFANGAEGQGRNPADLLDQPTRWKKLPEYLNPGEVNTLLKTMTQRSIYSPTPSSQSAVPAVSGESMPRARAKARAAKANDLDQDRDLKLEMRDRALLELMYSSGLRATETATLTLADVHPSLSGVRVIGKGDKQRMVPMGKPARQALDAYLAECRPNLLRGDGNDRGRVFLSRSGKPLERVAIWQIVKKWAKSAGLKDVHPHMLRHSFATHMLVGGADLRVLQELLGHADIATTQIYTHVDRSHLRSVHQKCHPRP